MGFPVKAPPPPPLQTQPGVDPLRVGIERPRFKPFPRRFIRLRESADVVRMNKKAKRPPPPGCAIASDSGDTRTLNNPINVTRTRNHRRWRSGPERDTPFPPRATPGVMKLDDATTSSPVRARHGTVSVIGSRKAMEDAVAVEPGFVVPSDLLRYDFYGVYDGHGGFRVAELCREGLHRLLAEEVERQEGSVDWETVMGACFRKMDGKVMGSDQSETTVGSTAVVAVVGEEEVVVANCGDSRAVLCRGGVAVPLSRDHKPERPDELKRIEAAGGRVINWDGDRVLGVLATSRSIGDQYLKPFVSCEPEVLVTERSDRDEFLILASDGLWDVVSNEVACKVVRRSLRGGMRRIRSRCMMSADDGSEGLNRSCTEDAAAMLVELAISRGSKDNISVIVIELRKLLALPSTN